MKKLITVLIVFSIALASAELDDAYICNKAFFFIIQNENRTIEDFRSIVKENVSEDYLLNYSDKCKDGRSIPTKGGAVNSLNLTKVSECNPNINKTILFDSIDLDSELKIGLNLYLEEPSCGFVNKIKYFASIDRTENGFKIDGVKTWFLLFLAGIIITIALIKSTRLTNRVAQTYLRRNHE